MKNTSLIAILSMIICVTACNSQVARTGDVAAHEPDDTIISQHLFLDVHNLEPGKIKFADVENAHQKDLATQDHFGANFIKYWVDELAGKVYCLVSSPDSAAIALTHKAAHGLIPDRIHRVSDGVEADAKHTGNLFLDIHKLGAGNVTAKAVADAHVKDLAVQGKRNVNFINYWVDEKSGTVMCLSEAQDSSAVIETHREAHGLLPAEIHQVQQGQ